MTALSAPQPQLIVFSGLPGTGKSTLAEEAARLLRCPIFGKDQVEATLWRSGIGAEANSGFAAYELLTTLAAGQLRLGSRRSSTVSPPWSGFALPGANWPQSTVRPSVS